MEEGTADSIFAVTFGASISTQILIPPSPLSFLSPAGEAFTSEEVEEMMSAAVDPDKQVIYYENHAMIMALDEEAYGRHLS